MEHAPEQRLERARREAEALRVPNVDAELLLRAVDGEVLVELAGRGEHSSPRLCIAVRGAPASSASDSGWTTALAVHELPFSKRWPGSREHSELAPDVLGGLEGSLQRWAKGSLCRLI
eukprot:scaffold28915_cov29-Tisochrysis_lutea.AAC.4